MLLGGIMEEKYEKQKKEISDFLIERDNSLRERKEETERYVLELEEKFKYTDKKEEIPELKESKIDLNKINKEIEKHKQEIKEIKRDYTDLTKVEKKIEELQKSKQELLKNRVEAQNEIKGNGVGKDEALRDILKIDNELNDKEKLLNNNYNIKIALEEDINKFVEKYNINNKAHKKEEHIEKIVTLNTESKNEVIPPERRIEQKQTKERPLISFNVKNGMYFYRDEYGKSTSFDLYKEKENGKFECINYKKYKKNIEKNAIRLGVGRKNAKGIDANVYSILECVNPDLADKYIQSFKEKKGVDKGFDIIYDLKRKDKEVTRDIGRWNLFELKRKSLKQEKLGIATMLKDKTKAKAYAILATLGITGGLSIAALNEGKQPERTNTISTENYVDKNQDKEKNEVVDIQNENEINNIQEEIEELHSGDYIKIKENALLYSDPQDSIRIKNGMNANETISFKDGDTKDRLYKITMEGYYSPDGSYISVKQGDNIKEVLNEMGLDESFINRDDTEKMYHVVANGVAQWVSADDVEKSKQKLDKFGNRIEKTEEEKEVDEAYQSYMREYDEIQQDDLQK